MGETNSNRLNYHLIPELMWGINKRMMIHAEGFISNQNGQFTGEGLGLYAKYRFFSRDQVYRHFRAAIMARATTNNGVVHQEMLMTNGHNSGWQAGLVATQLLHKTALSFTGYYERATNNASDNDFPAYQSAEAANYIMSVGHLVLPRSYNGYKQTNLNLMLEVIGQKLLGNGKQHIDIAPSVQLIFNSQTRLDIGYRYELYSTMQRTAPNGLLLRAEHLVFNTAFARKKHT